MLLKAYVVTLPELLQAVGEITSSEYYWFEIPQNPQDVHVYAHINGLPLSKHPERYEARITEGAGPFSLVMTYEESGGEFASQTSYWGRTRYFLGSTGEGEHRKFLLLDWASTYNKSGAGIEFFSALTGSTSAFRAEGCHPHFDNEAIGEWLKEFASEQKIAEELAGFFRLQTLGENTHVAVGFRTGFCDAVNLRETLINTFRRCTWREKCEPNALRAAVAQVGTLAFLLKWAKNKGPFQPPTNGQPPITKH